MLEKLRIGINILKFKYRLKFKSKKALEEYQNKKFQKQVDFVTKHSPYYKKLNLKKPYRLQDLPIVDKQIMMTHFNEMNTVGLDKDKVFEIALRSEKTRDFESKLDGITIGLSSGTSGNRGIFIASDKERAIWAGGILAKLLPLKMLPGCKIAFFMRANSNLYETVQSKLIQFKFFDMYQAIKRHSESLNEFSPDLLIAPPSVLIQLAQQVEEKKLCIQPKRIVSIAEVLEDKDKAYILKNFEVTVIHQVYQCTEGFLAYTCDQGTLHLNEEVAIIEKEYLSENRFVPIITDLERKSQPIIRYRLNDVLVEKKESCKCGSACLALEKIEGREDDIFIFTALKDQEDIKVFADFIRRCVLFVEGISNYRVIQEERGKITIQLEDTNKKIEEALLKEFQQLADELKCAMPEIRFEKYDYDGVKKLKRIERRFAI